MADVLIESFDFSKLDKWIKEADKQLALLANHSEEAAKRVNRALSDMGKADLDISAVNSMGQSLLDLKRKLSEINKEAKASTDPTIMGKLSKDSAKTIDDINKVFEAIEKVRKANDATDSVKLSELRAAYAKKKAQFDAGGIVQDIEGSKSIVPYNNVEMQQIIDEMKALKELIRIREMSTQEKINNAAKEAGKEKKIEDDKNKEIIASYKSMLSELSKLASEYSKIRISTYSTGETDDSKALEKNILKRYDELVESKVSLEEKGLDEISLLKEDFERKEQTREIENARKLYQEHKKKYKELAKAKREANQEKNTTVSGAMEFSREAKSISRRTVAIKNLESARNSLNTKDAKNLIIIREINDEIARQKMRIDELTKINKVQKESVSSVKNEYRSLLSEMRSLDRAYQKSMKATMDFGHTEQTDASIRAIMERYNNLRHRRIEIENKYWSEVSDIAAKNEAAMASDSMNRYRNQKNEEKKLFEKNKKKNLKDLAEEYEVESQEDSYEKWAAIASKKAEIRAEEERRLNEETERKKREQQDKNLQSEYDKSIDSQNKQLDNSLKNLGKERAAREKYMTDAVTKSKNSIRSEYGQINSEMIRLQDSYEKSLSLSERNGATDKSRRNEKRIYERYSELWGRKLEIEENFEDSVADLRDRYAAEEQRKELERENVKNKRRKSDSEKAAKERQREIEQARLEYKKIFEEIYNSQKSLERAKEGKEKFRESYNAEVNVEAVTNRIKSLNEKKSRLEKEFGYSLYKTRMEVEAKIQRDLIKQEEKNAKKRQDKNEEWLRTTEGATMFSDTAASINEEREAVKLLTAARDNLSRSTQKYDEIVADLNKRIDAHRVSIESKTKSQQQEQTLLPSVRNEYARILKEIDSLRESYIRLKKAEKDSGADLSKDKAAILARWKDIAIAKYNLEKDSQGQLDNIVRKHEAERAKANLEAFIRQEEEKARIAKKEAEERDREFAELKEKERRDAMTSVSGSIYLSKNAKTLKQKKEAIENLRLAQDGINISTKEGRRQMKRLSDEIIRQKNDIRKLEKEYGSFSESQSKVLDISEQLKRRLALVFSVSQITNYVNQLMNVRGEFEMQQRSLEVLLQNKEEATKLWDKTLALAVKSPFRVKELITYTKQLAAYRVEAEKLYDTNKMLADVSAGLGVDMNRLILAFGQVKAANYLRGTELRQFSEAGVNILEELSKYYSEIEKRTVTVGDVFEMVSNRMVKFADVEEIFKKITSEGGIFFQMQEEQSKTLKGIMMNLRDSYDIMLNDIGKDTNETIKGALKFTKYLVDNWRIFLPVIKSAGVAFSIYFGVKTIRNITAAVTILLRRLSLINFINPKAAIVTGVAAVVTYLSLATRKANRLRSALSDIEKEYSSLLEDSIGRYMRLTRVANDMTKSTKERARAMSNIKSVFGDILPQEMLEEQYVRNIRGNYSDATKAMRAYYNEKARIQKEQKIDSIFGEDIQDLTSRLQKNLSHVADYKYGGIAVFSDEEGTRLRASIDGAIIDIVEAAKNGKIKTEDIYKELVNKVSEYTGISYGKVEFAFKQFGESVSRKLSETISKMREEKEKIHGLPNETYAEAEATKALEKEKENVEKIKQLYSEMSSAMQEYARMKEGGASKDTMSDYLKNIYADSDLRMKNIPERFRANIKEMFSEMQSAAERGSYDLDYSMNSIYSKFLKNLTKNLRIFVPQKKDIVEAANRLMDMFTQSLNKEADGKQMSEFQKTIDKIYRKSAAITGGNLSAMPTEYLRDEETNLNSVLKDLEGSWKEMDEILDRFDNAVKAGTSKNDAAKNVGKTLVEISQMRRDILALNEANMRIGGSDLNKKKDKKESDDAVKILKNRISLIKELNSKYNELNKTFDKTTSKEQVMASYAETFKKAFEGTDIDFSDIVKIDANKFKDVASTLSDEVRKELEELQRKGSYIRSFSDEYIEKLVGNEGHKNHAYLDSNGIPTIGNGMTKDHLGNPVKMGDYWSDEKILEERTIQMKKYAGALNSVLNENKDLIITQKQYDALMDLTWQSWDSGVKNTIKYANNAEAFRSWLEKINGMNLTNGKSGSQKKILGKYEIDVDKIVEEYNKLENIYEKMAYVMKYVGIRTAVDKDTSQGMIDRAERRSSLFGRGLSVSKDLQKVLVNISAIDFTTPQGLVEILERLMPIAKKEGPESILALTRAVADFNAEIGKTEKEMSDKDILSKIGDMFGDYDISLDLEKLDIPSDLAKRLFGLDAMSLEELRSGLESYKDKLTGTESVEEYEKYLKRLEELEDKSRIERLKKYTSYLVNSRTEAVKIKLEELKQLEEIEDLNYTASEKSFIKNSIRRESRSKMDKIYWEEFKDSSVYLQIFQDLDNASKKSLDGMKERLMDIRDSLKDLSPTELKELISSMNRIDEARFKEDSLFKNLREYINLSRQIEKLDEENRRNIEEEDRLRILVKLQSNYVADKEHEYNLLVKEEGIEGKNARYAKVNLDSGRAQLNNLINELEKQKLITAEVAEQLRLFGKLEETTKGKAQKIIGQIEQAFSSLPKMGEDLQQIFGFDLDQKTKDILDSASAIGGGIANAAMSWMSGDYVGAVTSALGSIAAIFEIGDKKKERAIQREIEYVERLEKQYEKLGEAIDKAYSIDTLKESIRLSDENIKKQIESRKEMIQLEEDKKKTDHDRIKQWNEEIEELQKRQEELHRQQVENMGGTYDYKSAAEEFINAWREAFQETGDGLQGLKGHFKDFEKSLILKQAVMQGAATITKDLMDEINKSLEDDYGIDDGEWNNIDQTKENVFERLDEFLKGFYGQYEGIFDNKGGLSGLQESIQGITEQTAQILEAYLNSVRLFVADTNNKFTRFSDIYFSETENPMLSQLKIIAKQTDAIRRLFDGVVKSGHPQGGTGIKVFLN